MDGANLKMKIAIFLLLNLFAVFGCSNQIEVKSLVGKYVANHKKAADTLELNADGSYIYHYKSDSTEIKNSNKWSFEYVDGKPTITFTGFIFGLPGYGSKEPGFWIVEVRKSLGGVLKLTIDPDLGYYYSKESS
jgi:hypothetical protein